MIRRLEMDLMRSARLLAKKSGSRMFLGGTFGVAAWLSLPQAHCAAKDKEKSAASASYFGYFSQATAGGNSGASADSDGKSDPVKELIEQYMPTVQKLGFGGLMGICTGVAMKRIGNGAAAIIGVGFICLQGLSYMGYITVDYNKVAEDATKLIDVDGDGQLTTSDITALWSKLKDVFSYNLPGASGFSAGFAMGLYFGN